MVLFIRQSRKVQPVTQLLASLPFTIKIECVIFDFIYFCNVYFILTFKMLQRQKCRQSSKSKNRLSSISNSSDTDSKRGLTEGHQNMRLVTIYDASGLMPLQQELGERYV